MDLTAFLDPTTLCVAAIMLAFTLLWAYVALYGGKRDHPDLSALYEPISKGSSGSTGAKKPSKTKSKKQGDVSPRAAAKPPTTEPQLESTSARPTAKKQRTQRKDTTAKSIQDVGAKGKGRKVHDDPSEQVERKEQLEGDEGEWQMQLSRQQLRALRQKQRQDGDKAGSSSDSEPVKSGKSGSGSEETAEDASKQTSAEKTSYSKGGRKGKATSKKQRSDTQKATTAETKQDSSETPKDVSTDTTKTEGEQVAAASPLDIAGDLPSSDQRIPSPPEESSGGLTEVEKALQEAAQSSSPSPEVEEKEGEFAQVKPKRQKKSRRKDTQAEKSPSTEPTVEEHDDWVVI